MRSLKKVAKVLLFKGSISRLSSLVEIGCVICLMFVGLLLVTKLNLKNL